MCIGFDSLSSHQMKQFPILFPDERQLIKICKELDCPRSIPWALMEQGREQAKDNHDQSLKTLARRFGLCPSEAVAALEGLRWREYVKPFKKNDNLLTWSRAEEEELLRASVIRLKELVKEFEA